jgi:hypothetical protein
MGARLGRGLVLLDGVVQPEWKQCSRCLRTKRIQKFHRMGKRFRRGVCVTCRSEQDRGRAR